MIVIGATFAPTYAGFTALRTLQGLFNTSPQVIGLTIIHDLFFFHERTRKINMWAFTFLFGPNFGPCMSSLILSRLGWRQDYAILASMYGFSMLVVCLIGQETLYDRNNPQFNPKVKGLGGRIALVTGITGIRAKGRPTIASVIRHILQIQVKPHILLVSKYHACSPSI